MIEKTTSALPVAVPVDRDPLGSSAPVGAGIAPEPALPPAEKPFDTTPVLLGGLARPQGPTHVRRGCLDATRLLTDGRRPAMTPERSAVIESCVDEVIGQMTLDEKVAQLTLYAGDQATGPAKGKKDFSDAIADGKIGTLFSVRGAKETNRLQRIAMQTNGWPVNWEFDTIHGYRTIFPINLAMASSFDPSVAKSMGLVAGKETKRAGIREVYSPMVEVSRDARWGRMSETAGEDPYLASRMAEASVLGFNQYVGTTLKHFVGYSKPTAGRDYTGNTFSEGELRDVYLPPFEAGLDAGANQVMAGYNTVDGVPMSANRAWLTDYLQHEKKFSGPTVSDWTGVENLIRDNAAATPERAVDLGMDAGITIDMQSDLYNQYLKGEVLAGRVSSERLDDSVRRVLRNKFALGLFADPYTPESGPAPLDRSASYAAAVRSMVLLKNDGNVLPLRNVKSIAIVGALADNPDESIGAWMGMARQEDNTTTRQAIERIAKEQNIATTYVPGGAVDSAPDAKAIDEAVAKAKDSDVIIAVVGEPRAWSGEAASRTDIELPPSQKALLRALHERTGKPVVAVLMNGRPLALPWEAEHVPAILEAWHLGTEHGPAVADALFGRVNPSGKLPVSFPRNVGQVPMTYAELSTGRPMVPPDDGKNEDDFRRFTSRYMDSPNSPQFPFGFGLSYTTFSIGEPQLASATTSPLGGIDVTVDVKNTGERAGREVVQLYVHANERLPAPPVRELKGFTAVDLAPGETKQVTIHLKASDLAFYSPITKTKAVAAGDYTLWVSNSSEVADRTPVHFSVR